MSPVSAWNVVCHHWQLPQEWSWIEKRWKQSLTRLGDTHSHLCWAAHCVTICVPTQPEHVFTKLKMLSLSLSLARYIHTLSHHNANDILWDMHTGMFGEHCSAFSAGFRVGPFGEKWLFWLQGYWNGFLKTFLWKPQNIVAFSNGTDDFIFLKFVNVRFLC